jgi:hypothetical protein
MGNAMCPRHIIVLKRYHDDCEVERSSYPFVYRMKNVTLEKWVDGILIKDRDVTFMILGKKMLGDM